MRKIFLLAGFTVLLLVAAYFCRAAALDPEGLLSRKDPARGEYERFVERFSERRYGYVVVHHPATADVQNVVGEISEFLSRSPSVSRVVSPQNARYFLGSEYLSFSSLFPKPELTDEARDRLRSEVWRRTLFPDDPTRIAILFEHAPSASEWQDRELATTLAPFLEGIDQKHPGVETSVLGPRLLHGARYAEAARSFKFEIPVLLFCFALIVGFLFRSPAIVLWSLLTIVASLYCSVALLGWVSGGITSIGVIALQWALVTSFSGVMFFFLLLQSTGGRLSQRLAQTRKLGDRPALVFSLVLGALFLGCLMSRYAPVRDLGLVCAATCVIQWLITFRALPIAIAEFGYHSKSRRMPFKGRLKIKKAYPSPVSAFVAGSAAFIVSALVTSWVRPGDSSLSSLVPLRKVDVILKPKYWDVFDPDNQAELLALEQRIADLPGVERVASLASLNDDLLSILAMRKPGQGEKLRKELVQTLEEEGALKDFRAPGAKEARTVVLLKPGIEPREVVDGIESLSRQVQGRISVQVAGLAAFRKALSIP